MAFSKVNDVEKLKSLPIEFIWKVDVTKTESSRDFISSPKFSMNDDSDSKYWYLKLYPNGKQPLDDMSKSKISLFLKYTGSVNITVLMALSLMNNDDEKVFEIKEVQSFKPGEAWGHKYFYHLNPLKDLSKNLFRGNILSISCTLETQEDVILKKKIYEENISKLNVLTDLEKLLANKDFCDITLTADDGKSFHAHKCILATCSTVFEAMFKHNQNENNEKAVEINDIKSEVLEKLIQFIYTRKADNIESVVCELLTAAKKYAVKDLTVICEKTMCKNINMINALEVLSAANINDAHEVKIAALNYISLHFICFIKNSKFKVFGKAHPELMFEIMQAWLDIDNLKEDALVSEKTEELNISICI